MKIRNGFVSNSSSSSFVLAYNKDSVITDTNKIVEYIENNLRGEILFISDLCEGDDVFYLNMDQKNYLLAHRKRFVQYSSGTDTITDYSAIPDENDNYPKITRPHVTAITETYRFNYDPNEYFNPEVDMSDIPEVEITTQEWMDAHNDIASEEVKEKVRLAKERQNIQWRREREARQKVRDKYLEEVRGLILNSGNVNPDTLKVEYIEVDRNSCDGDHWCENEFAPRYFGLSDRSYDRFVQECDGDEEFPDEDPNDIEED